MPVAIASVPKHFQSILMRISDVLDADVEVDSYDKEWLNFWVEGYSDHEAMDELEKNKMRVLLSAEALNVRMLCAWDPNADEGLWLHSLSHCDTPNDYLRGNWYY
jgi:hypothetical protein